MSLEARRAYRFIYLKSEKWQTLRLTCLAMDEGKCVVCGKYSESNDAHHLFYRSNWDKTQIDDLLTLCRTCHEATHDLGKAVLVRGLWDRYRWTLKKTLPEQCSVCLTTDPNGKTVTIPNGKTTFHFCLECFPKFDGKPFDREFWKLFETEKDRSRVFTRRKFCAYSLKQMLGFGIERSKDINRFFKVLPKVVTMLKESMARGLTRTEP